MKPEVLNEVPVTSFEVREFLEKTKKEQGDLSFRAQKTLDHLEQTITIKKKQVEELKEALEKLKVSRLKEQHIDKLIDLRPASLDQLKVIMQGYVVNVKQEDMKKILSEIEKLK